MRYSADAVLIFCTLLWGLTFSLVKESLSETGPLYINVLRFVFSGVLFLPAAILRRRQVRLSTVTWGFGLGVLLFYGFAFQTMGLGTTTAQRSAFLTQMLVIFAPIFQLLLFRVPIRAGTIAGIAIVLPGLYFLLSAADVPFADNVGMGDLLGLGCAATYGLYMVLLDRATRHEDVVLIVFFQIVFAAACFVLAFSISDEKMHLQVSSRYITAIAYLSIATTVLTTYLQSRFQKLVSAARAGVLYSMEPVFASIFAFALLGENPGMRGYAGGGLILFGVILSETWPFFMHRLRRYSPG